MVAIGVSQQEGSMQLLFASSTLTFYTAALNYLFADIIQHSVPSAVSTFYINAPRYILLESDRFFLWEILYLTLLSFDSCALHQVVTDRVL